MEAWTSPTHLTIVAPEIEVREENFDVRPGDTLSWRVWPGAGKLAPIAPSLLADYYLDLYGHLFGEAPDNVRVEGIVVAVEAVCDGDDRAAPSVIRVPSTLVSDVPNVQSFLITLSPGACVREGTTEERFLYRSSRPA